MYTYTFVLGLQHSYVPRFADELALTPGLIITILDVNINKSINGNMHAFLYLTHVISLDVSVLPTMFQHALLCTVLFLGFPLIVCMCTQDPEGGWWLGRVGAREGWFPSTRVEVQSSTDAVNTTEYEEEENPYATLDELSIGRVSSTTSQLFTVTATAKVRLCVFSCLLI